MAFKLIARFAIAASFCFLLARGKISVSLRCPFVPQVPFVIDSGPLPGQASSNTRHQSHALYGYQVEMVESIFLYASMLNSSLQFSCDYYATPDQTSGALVNGSWSGVVGELVAGRGDIAIAPTSQTEARTEAILFGPAWRPAPLALLALKSVHHASPWGFVMPFDGPVWGALAAFVGIFAACLMLTERCSPFGVRYLAHLDPHSRRRLDTSEVIAGACASVLGGSPPSGALAWSTRVTLFAMTIFSVLVRSSTEASGG